MRRALAAVALTVGLAATGLAATATPAAAHGCSHSNHYTVYAHSGLPAHAHWTVYLGYVNDSQGHWHLWDDVHGAYLSFCG